jgi:S-adenosylhomocysteine hydrolase
MRTGGNPPRVLGITFTLQILAHILVSKGWKLKPGTINQLPTDIDEEVAKLNFPEIERCLVKLTNEQKKYLSGETLLLLDRK